MKNLAIGYLVGTVVTAIGAKVWIDKLKQKNEKLNRQLMNAMLVNLKSRFKADRLEMKVSKLEQLLNEGTEDEE